MIDTDPTAVMGRRILAWILDLVLFAGVVLGVFAALAAPVDIPQGFVLDACERLQALDSDEARGCIELGDTAYITSTADTGIQTLTTLGYFAFFVLLQGLTGASPGKLLTGLRVVDEEGRRAGVGRSLVRTLLWVIDGAPWFLPLVGFVTGLTSTGHRRVGDLAAKTYVVSRAAVGAPPIPPEVAQFGAPTWSPPTAAPAPQSWAPAPPAAERPTLPAASPQAMPEPDVTTPVDEAPPEVGADPTWWSGPEADHATGDWAPPTTPGEEFDIVAEDASPTAGPTPFVAPGSEAPPPTAPSPALPPPQWDQARNTYIQWEPGPQRWLQWDTVHQRWKPIDS